MILVHAGDDVQAVVATAAAGETVHLGAGRHRGPLLVDRSLTIEGEPGTILEGPGRGTVLTIDADDVTVRGLRVRGSGRDATLGDAGVLVTADRAVVENVVMEDVLIGLDVRQSNDGLFRNCEVRGDDSMPLGQRGDGIRIWESKRNRVQHNQLDSVRDVIVWYATENWIVDNVVRNSRYGTHLMHADDNVVAANVYEQDVVGVFVMYSHDIDLWGNRVTGAHGAAGMGLGFKESDAIRAFGNHLYGNTVGVYLDATPQRIGGSALFTGNTLAYNHTGLRVHGSQTGATLVGNAMHENATQASVDGRSNASGSYFLANQWSDYAGYDLDRDGYGDLAYTPQTLSGGLTERRPAVGFFTGTPAAALLDLLAAAFPMFAPRPLLTDARPRLG